MLLLSGNRSAKGKPRVLPPYVLLSCVVIHGLRMCGWWSIMTQENPICYENTRDGKSGLDLENSVNILCKTTSSRDPLVHEND